MLMRTFFSHIRVLIIVLLLLSTAAGPARAQFLQDGASGLMLAPSADMNPSGTFMITNTFLDPHVLPPFPWGYDTFGYSINITFWSRFEVAYVLTLLDGKRMENPPSAWWRAQNNQDRHFYAKFLLVKENEFGWKWVPAIAAGVSDPVTGAVNGEYIGSTDMIDFLSPPPSISTLQSAISAPISDTNTVSARTVPSRAFAAVSTGVRNGCRARWRA